MRASLLLLVLFAALAASAQIRWVQLDSIQGGMSPVEGLWHMRPGGAIFTVDAVKGKGGEYAFELLYSPMLAIKPGTHMGTMNKAALEGVYEADFTLDPTRRKGRHKSFTVEMNPESSRFVLKPYTQGWSLNIYRLLPYLFRIGVKRTDTRPDIDGAVRIAPQSFNDIIVL